MGKVNRKTAFLGSIINFTSSGIIYFGEKWFKMGKVRTFCHGSLWKKENQKNIK